MCVYTELQTIDVPIGGAGSICPSAASISHAPHTAAVHRLRRIAAVLFLCRPSRARDATRLAGVVAVACMRRPCMQNHKNDRRKFKCGGAGRVRGCQWVPTPAWRVTVAMAAAT
jgi:hypothetical protein